MNDVSYNNARISKTYRPIKLNPIPANGNVVSTAKVEYQSIWSSNLNIIINPYCTMQIAAMIAKSCVLNNKSVLKNH